MFNISKLYRESIGNRCIYWSLGVVFIFAVLFYVALQNYLLFHTVTELFNVLVAMMSFVIVINLVKEKDSSKSLNALGIAYAFIGALNLLHTLSVKGLGIFFADANLAVQLGTISRFVECFTLVLFSIMHQKKMKLFNITILYTLVTLVLLFSVFQWRIFPVCYIEGHGPTLFKVITAYFFSFIYLISILILFNNRKGLQTKIYYWLLCSFASFMATEVLFALYTQTNDYFSITGHLMKVLAFYFIYKAIVESSLESPYEKLRESEKKYSNLFEFSTAGLALISADRKVIQVNNELCQITGYTKEELIEGGLTKITLSDDKEREEFFYNMLSKGEIDSYQLEIRYIHKHGHTIWIYLNVSYADGTNSENAPFVARIADITTRKCTEQELRESEERYRQLIESIPQCVAVHDKDWRYVISNNLKAARLKHITKQQLTDMTIYDLWPNIEDQAFFQAYKRVMEMRQPESVVDYLVFSDGSGEWHQFNAFPVPEGIMAIGVNITQQKEAELALQKSRERYEAVINSFTELFCVLDFEYRYVIVNEDTEKQIKDSIANSDEEFQVIGKKITEINPNVEDTAFFKAYKKGMETRQPQVVVDRYINKKGESGWYEVRVYPVSDGIMIIGLDVTQRITEQELLDRSRKLFEGVFKTLDALVVLLDPQGNIQRMNHACKNTTGFKNKEIAGSSYFDLIDGEDCLKVSSSLSQILNSQQPVKYECHWKTKHGSLRLIECSNTVLLDKDGEVDYIIVTGIDITEKRRDEIALRESRENYRQLIEMMPDGVLVVDEMTTLSFINQAGLKILGAFHVDNVIGRYITEFILPSDQDEVKRIATALHRDKGSIGLQQINISKLDGAVMTIEFSTMPLVKGDGFSVLIVFRDITERKRAENLQLEVDQKTIQLKEAFEMDRLRTEFFANLSHEFRTPLNIILSSAQLLRGYLNHEPRQLDINKLLKSEGYIRQNCYRLLRLINNLIDATRIDADFYELKLVNCNVVEIVENITLSVADYIDNKNLNLSFDTDVEERIIAIDPNAMERILLNLLANAVKFTNRGGSISVEIIDGEEFVTVVVADTGIGIPEEYLERIFDRFTQADKSFTKHREGSGIGLSLVKSLVELHGGSIKIQSVNEGGTTLIIQLPVKTVDNVRELSATYCEISRPQTESIHIEFSDIYS